MSVNVFFSDATNNFVGPVTVTTQVSPKASLVSYYLNGTIQVSRDTPAYTWVFDSTTQVDGAYTIYAIGTFKNGRTESSPVYNVTIKNTPTGDVTPPSTPGSFAKAGSTETSITATWNSSTDSGGSNLAGYNLYKNNVFVGTAPVSSAASYKDVVLSDSPLSYWRLGEAIGNTTVGDSAGAVSGAVGSAVTLGATGLVSGESDTAVSFSNPASAECKITFGNVYPFTGTSPFTIEAWVKPNATGITNNGFILANRNATDGWYLRIASSKFRFGRMVSSSEVNANSTTTVTAGNTYHVVGTYDGTNSKIYINGTLEATSSSDTRSLVNPGLSTTLGRYPASGSHYADVADEVAIYGTALSAARISAHNAPTSTNSYIFSGLTCGTSYSLSVEAFDGAGNKSAKSTITAATSTCPAQSVPVIQTGGLPQISGNTTSGSTLTCSTGSWSNSPTGYTYEFRRCNASGGFVAVARSRSSVNTYTLTSSDVDFTIRCSVIASNASGDSLEAVSAATAIVTTSQPMPGGFYYFEHFDNSAFTYSNFWGVQVPGFSFASSPSVSGGSAKLVNCASVSSTQQCSGSGSTYGQLTGISVVSTPTNDRPHAGRILGSGTGCCDGDGVSGRDDTWYRFHIYFPTGFAATSGTQNSLWEIHVDDKSIADGKAGGGSGAYSCLIGLQADGTCPGPPYFCSSQGTNPRFFYQIAGGQLPGATFTRRYPFAPNSLKLNWWYDIVIRIKWAYPAGIFQSWVDGVKWVDETTLPTLYRRRDGTLSYGENVALLYYRYWANWETTVYYDEVLWGPTAASIGFVP